MVSVSFHYWAGACAAAGLTEETVVADSVAEALDTVFRRRSDPRFERVVRASTLLIAGLATREAEWRTVLEESVEVEVLPPFAGGQC